LIANPNDERGHKRTNDMGALKLRHLENILYREDALERRIELLYRWTSNKEIDLKEFDQLLKSCDKRQLDRDNKRKYNW